MACPQVVCIIPGAPTASILLYKLRQISVVPKESAKSTLTGTPPQLRPRPSKSSDPPLGADHAPLVIKCDLPGQKRSRPRRRAVARARGWIKCPRWGMAFDLPRAAHAHGMLQKENPAAHRPRAPKALDQLGGRLQAAAPALHCHRPPSRTDNADTDDSSSSASRNAPHMARQFVMQTVQQQGPGSAVVSSTRRCHMSLRIAVPSGLHCPPTCTFPFAHEGLIRTQAH